MPISWLDVILITVMLISGFLAMVRGFTREVLSIFSWAMAAVAALYLTPKYSGMLSPYINNPSIAQIAFAAGVFVVTLIVVSLITFRISDSVLDSRVGALDRTFGFIFGLARGFLLVAIVFILFTALARDQPDWYATPVPTPFFRRHRSRLNRFFRPIRNSTCRRRKVSPRLSNPRLRPRASNLRPLPRGPNRISVRKLTCKRICRVACH